MWRISFQSVLIPSSHYFHIQILLIKLHAFSYSTAGRICWKVKAFSCLEAILLILITSSLDEVLILLGEIWWWSLLGLTCKGSTVQVCFISHWYSLIHSRCYYNKISLTILIWKNVEKEKYWQQNILTPNDMTLIPGTHQSVRLIKFQHFWHIIFLQKYHYRVELLVFKNSRQVVIEIKLSKLWQPLRLPFGFLKVNSFNKHAI